MFRAIGLKGLFEMKFTAAVLRQNKQPLSVEGGLRIPKLRHGEVLVELAFSGICHSQLMEINGLRGVDHYLPHLLGHEGTGKVIGVGPGVKKVNKDDWVILGWIKSSGINISGVQYEDSCGNIINGGAVTTFNTHAVVSENRVTKLPTGLPLDVGVLFGCALLTGAGMITNTLKPREGSSILIFGLGGIGMSALIASSLYKCKQVIAVDVSEEKLNLAKKFGATNIINAGVEDVSARVLELTLGEGVDYAVESAGKVNTIEKAFELINMRSGVCVFASHPKNGEKITIDPFELICGKKIIGSWGGDCNPEQDIPKFAELYLNGKLPLDELIENRYPLSDINKALEDLKNNRVNRPIIVINQKLDEQYKKQSS